MSFQDFPTEIQCSVIRLLDPISLISISQTSKHFRHLVNPSKKHFLERLLTLETSAKHAGPTPIFRSRDNRLDPDLVDPSWNAMRWACTSCFRLLPHVYFDNHSILRLGYRKPIPNSPAASLISSWEPTGQPRIARAQLHNDNAKPNRSSQRKMRWRYSVCVTAGLDSMQSHNAQLLQVLQECGIVGLEGISHTDFQRIPPSERLRILDDNALSIELERCGHKRHLRQCIQCQYMSGKLNPRPDRCSGTSELPIVVSRRIPFATHLDRYFPGFSTHLQHKRPPFDVPLPLVHRRKAHDQPWTMYMIRCPSCTRWQELREFRIGGVYQHWKPAMGTEIYQASRTWDDREITDALLNKLRCNACLAQTDGREELGKALLKWINCLIDLELHRLSWYLKNGGGLLDSLLRKGMPKKYELEVKRILRDTPYQHDESYATLNYAEVAILKLRHSQWRRIWERMEQDGETRWASEDMNEWFQEWKDKFDVSEAHWRWLMGSKDELQQKPEALVEWALGGTRGDLTSGYAS